MTVRKAVVPAAGLGTRFLPATKALPKEMIPVVDRPGVQYTIEEAARAGIDDVLLVSGWGKVAMEDHFDRAIELEAHLEKGGKTEELAEVRRLAELARVFSVRQKEPLGFGHAVLQAKDHIAGDAFAVLVPDEIVPEPRGDEVDLLPRMLEVFEDRDAYGVIAVQEVPLEDIAAYGVVAPESVENDVGRITDMIEKPQPEDAPSNLAARGRYVFRSEIFDAIERTAPGYGGEIQLTDAIRLLAQEHDVFAYIHRGPMYDVGKKLDYLRATVELALRRDDLAKPFREFLLEIAERSG